MLGRLFSRCKKVDNNRDIKQVILVRTDLGMGKGKIAAQVAHASLGSCFQMSEEYPELCKRWVEGGSKKVVLKVDSLEELLEIKKKLDHDGIPNVIIRDAGHTQVSPGTITCLGIGPWYGDELDKYTGHLKLL